MKRFPQVYFSTTAVVLAGLLLAAPAQALDGDAAKCRAALGKNLNKYVKTMLKNGTKCHKDRNGGKLSNSVECNDPTNSEGADVKGKLDKARTKFLAATGSGTKSKCSDSLTDVLATYARCPSPSQTTDDGGATLGIDTFDEVAGCLASLAEEHVEELLSSTLGSPVDAPFASGSDAGACLDAIAKNVAKAVTTIGSEKAKCQAALDKEAGDDLSYQCNDSDPKGKIASTLASLDAAIAASCDVDDDSGVDTLHEIDALGLCGDTVEQLQECVAAIAAPRIGAGLIATAYELPETCRAGRMVRVLNGAFGEKITDTVLSTGWSGTSHNVDVVDQFIDTVDLDCDDDCADCTLSVEPVPERPEAYCRCANDPKTSCTLINTPDPDSCGLIGDNTCNCNFGPPLPLSSGNVPVCVANRIRMDHAGSRDLGAGAEASVIFDAALVHLGESVLNPCPTCDNDTTPNDGVRDGTCVGGLQAGTACDAHANSVTFGATSHDCPPDSIDNISGSGLLLALDFSSGESTLPFTLPCDAAGLCPCRVCSGNTNLGCANDQECADAGAGACTAGGGAGVFANACTDGVCTNNQCLAGPTDSYCDGITRGDGSGFLACNTDAECALNSAGNCSIEQGRPCFSDPIHMSGTEGIFSSSLATIFCIPATSSAPVNSSAGLPGAGVAVLNLTYEPRCATDVDEIYVGPTGANCPEGPAVTTTTTTSTTLLPSACGDTFPTCGGDCPIGSSCANTGLACACEPDSTTTTTTMPPAACGGTFPTCDGSCPVGSSCEVGAGTCECVTTPLCADSAPACGGGCPGAQTCTDVVGNCVCL